MLIDGEIDLMSDVSYTPDRSEQMLFPSLAMGAEEYYIFTMPDNTEIRQDEPHTLDGKKVCSSDFFFAVNRERPDLLMELNAAMNRIQSENRYYTQQLSLKYISTSGAAIDALRNEEVDCVFPSNLGTSDGETLGLIMTPAVMSSDIYAVVRSSDRDSFSSKTQVTVAIEENDPNYDSLMLDHFPSWQAEAYPDMEKCFTAVSNGRADCILFLRGRPIWLAIQRSMRH